MAAIYIVEDDLNIREIETFALKNVGYDVEDFDCAKTFYERLQHRTPTLIILDIMLPDEDGLTILKNLRSRSETRKIPIIMVTAKTTEIDKVKGLDMGADDYMTKPFGVMELISRVKACCAAVWMWRRINSCLWEICSSTMSGVWYSWMMSRVI